MGAVVSALLLVVGTTMMLSIVFQTANVKNLFDRLARWAGIIFRTLVRPKKALRPKPDYRKIELLEEWHEYWRQGCYRRIREECPHEKEITRKKDRMLPGNDFLFYEFQVVTMQQPRCYGLDKATDSNRFDYLDSWLKDVDNLLKRPLG